jgi:hypothetical protein
MHGWMHRRLNVGFGEGGRKSLPDIAFTSKKSATDLLAPSHESALPHTRPQRCMYRSNPSTLIDQYRGIAQETPTQSNTRTCWAFGLG